MYNTNKSLFTRFLVIGLVALTLAIHTSFVIAEEDYGNAPPDPNMMMLLDSMESIDLPFDPNNYNFLVYNPGGSYARIIDAMEHLGIYNYDVRGYVNGNIVSVTATDLAMHDILIVGWYEGGNTNGLNASVLQQGITGRIILSGHDLDFHTSPPPGGELCYREAAERMLVQAIDYVLKSGGTGMITLGDARYWSFPYLPSEWGVSSRGLSYANNFTEFTAAGLASGVFDGLEPSDMCNWDQSYHNTFDISNAPDFVVFERGGSTGQDNITVALIGATWSPLLLTKTDSADANEVKPGDTLVYTIGYQYPSGLPNWTNNLTNVVLTDHLPPEVNFESASQTYDYNPDTREVTIELGTLSPGTNASVTITTTVGTTPPPTREFTNTAAIIATETNEVTAKKRTLWGPRVCNITQNKWYTVIQDAIDEANEGDTVKVWQGRYYERLSITDKSIKLIAADPNPANTIIDANSLDSPITALSLDSSSSLISGFTFTKGHYGVYLLDSSPHIENCVISGCRYGIYSPASDYDSHPVVVNSSVRNNSWQGIYISDSSATVLGSTIESHSSIGIYAKRDLTVSNCVIRSNGSNGIRCGNYEALRVLKNSIISASTFGIWCEGTSSTGSEITGCTIYCTSSCAIMSYGPIPIRNSILWAPYPCGDTNYNVAYSCVKNGYTGGGHNISSDPCFVSITGAGEFHLKPESKCISRGDPNYYFNPADGESDIDKQPRKLGSWIDIGADEYDVNNPDFDNNSEVNFFDYAIFANAWQTTLGSANWNADCNIATNSWGIDYRDLDIFINWWLWEATAYKMESESYLGDGMMLEQQQQEFSLELAEELLMGIDYNYPTLYLTCDTNTPDVNDEVTVYVKSDWPLLDMETAIYVNGDADIICAMDSNEAPDFGWDPGWYFPELIDDGWVSIGGVRWAADANGTVGYIKLRYNSGQVSVYFDQQLSNAYTWTGQSCPQLPFSQEAILIGRDPNE